MSEFIFTTCQVGAESALKAELGRDWPDLRLAFSRPGFLTFKLPENHGLGDHGDLRSVFARSSGFSLGKTMAESLGERIEELWRLTAAHNLQRLHVWQRDRMALPRLEEPLPRNALAEEAELAIRQSSINRAAAALHTPDSRLPSPDSALSLHHPTRPGDLVLDCAIVEQAEWWIGFHRALNVPSCWPGGIYQSEVPPDAVSRAYLKMEEALAWSRLPIAKGDLCAEIGSAPGGASQALLNHGLNVIGVDPAEMDPRVLKRPNFVHVRKRGADVRRREFRKVRWLTADINIAPNYTLDTVEAIVTHSDVHIQGMLLTLKLLDWSLAIEIPTYLNRIRSWGFSDVQARQLSHNRQEICVAATAGKSKRR